MVRDTGEKMGMDIEGREDGEGGVWISKVTKDGAADRVGVKVGDAVLAYTDRRSTLLDKLGENGPLRLQWEMLERAVRDVREDGPLRDDAAEWLRGERDADLLPFCSATSCLATFRLDQAAVCEALGI